jgi:DNA primase
LKEFDRMFEALKKSITLCEYLAKYSDSLVMKVGEGTYRANPCPMCGHRNCCTIYEVNQTFHCFSCGKTGDIIHLEKYLNGFGSNLEAARSLSRKYQSINQTDGKRMNSIPVKKNDAEAADALPPKERLLALRNLAADYYHSQLLSDKNALDYLLNGRKHSLDVIKHFKVGFGGGNLIAHATDEGYSVTDLESIGLVRKNNRSYSLTIPSGLYVFPHMKDGDVLFFTIKDPAKKMKFQVKKQFAAPGWLCMNQDALSQPSVIVVEGENDLLSVFDKAKQPNVIATIGNFNTPNILAHLKSHSAGKSFYLCFDNDDAGRRYTNKYSAAILEGGGKAHAISL